MTELTTKPLLTLSAAGKIVACHPTTLAREIRAGRLRGVNIGTGTRRHEWRVDPEDLRAWINARRTSTSPASELQRMMSAQESSGK